VAFCFGAVMPGFAEIMKVVYYFIYMIKSLFDRIFKQISPPWGLLKKLYILKYHER